MSDNRRLVGAVRKVEFKGLQLSLVSALTAFICDDPDLTLRAVLVGRAHRYVSPSLTYARRRLHAMVRRRFGQTMGLGLARAS